MELRTFDADAGNELDQGCLRAYVRFQMPRPDCMEWLESGDVESESEIEGFASESPSPTFRTPGARIGILLKVAPSPACQTGCQHLYNI